MFLPSIEDDEAKKTLLAMIRERWPIGKYTFSEIDAAYPKWLGLRVVEFQVSIFFILSLYNLFFGLCSILILVLVHIM